MKLFTTTLLILSVCMLTAAENLMKKPETTYKVSPGNWHKGILSSKKLGNLIDRDLDTATGKRKGMLSDGKTFQQAVAYNYHNKPKEQRYLTVDIDLGKPVDLSSINVIVMENNNLHKPEKAEITVSTDNMIFRDTVTVKDWVKKQYDRKAVFSKEWKQVRFVRVKVYCASTWINLTEVEIFAK